MNWTITDGDIYVSKNGNDTTGDGSMSLPYASINKATDSGSTGNKIVIGTGLWQEARGTSTNIYSFYGDGEVIFDYSGVSYFKPYIDNILFTGADLIVSINFTNTRGLSLTKYVNTGSYNIGNIVTYINCNLDVISTDIGFGNGFGGSFISCSINEITSIYNVNNAYVYLNIDKCTIIKLTLYSATYKNHYIYGLQNSIILQHDISYASNVWISLQRVPIYNLVTSGNETTGSPQNIFFDSTNIPNLDPKFNNESIGDYTLQPDSPCLFAGKNNMHIGPFGIGYNFDANSSEFTEEGGAAFSQSDVGSGLENDIVKTSQTINGVTARYFILNTDHTEGTIESEWIDFQTLYELNSAKLFANFIYNEDGVATSRVDIDNNDTGEFPNQYDFEMKYVLDEDDKATATWNEVIWNKELSNVSARFIKLKIYMKG